MLPSPSVKGLLMIAALLVTMSSASYAVESQNEWEKKYTSGIQALEDKRYTKAERALLSAMNGTESNEQLVLTLEALSRVYEETDDDESEEQVLRSLLKICDDSGQSPKHRGDLLIKLGAVNCNMRHYVTAERYFNQAFTVLKDACGLISPDAAVALNNLAWIEQRKGRMEKADRLFRRSLGIVGKTLGRKSVLYGLTASNLAEVYILQSRLTPAVYWLQIAKSVLIDSLGKDDPMAAEVTARFESIVEVAAERRVQKNVRGKIIRPRRSPSTGMAPANVERQCGTMPS